MIIYISDICPFCKSVNYVSDGDPTDISEIDVEGIKCWNCEKEWVLNSETNIEDAYIENGEPNIGVDKECICNNNWRKIIPEYEKLINRLYRDSDNKEYRFNGIMWGDDDFYYVMSTMNGKTIFPSCVGSLEEDGFTLIEEK